MEDENMGIGGRRKEGGISVARWLLFIALGRIMGVAMIPVSAEEVHERTEQDEQERSVAKHDLPMEEVRKSEDDRQAKDDQKNQTLIGTAEHLQEREGD